MVKGSSSWFEGVNEATEPIHRTRMFPIAGPLADAMPIGTIAFGHRLGFLDDTTVVAILTERLRLGVPLVEHGLRLAVLLRSDLGEVSGILADFPDDLLRSDAQANAFWLHWVVESYQLQWREGRGDVHLDFSWVESMWGREAHTFWSEVESRGFDRLYSGAGASARMLDRIDAWLAAHEVRQAVVQSSQE